MKSKDYRELQLSSIQLVIIFIGILVIGVVIFLLGVSVGKKQTQLAEESITIAQPESKKIEVKPPTPAQKKATKPKKTKPEEPKDKKSESIKKEIASHREAKEKTKAKPAISEKENLYYIQIGAYEFKKNAMNIADGFKKNGYPSVVIDPLPLDKKPWYRVRVGGYKSKEEAAEALSKLLKLGITKKRDYFIVER